MSVKFSDLLGYTLQNVIVNKNGDNDSIIFVVNERLKFKMYHYQDCCESVTINDICGDVQDLVGSPIVRCSEDINTAEDGEYGDTQTWTFYNIATVKGYVTIRWHGSSNGYYSESVDFKLMEKDDEN